jgi:hypothetical protein
MALTVVHHPGYTIDLPANHPFPMEKFRVLRQPQSLEWHPRRPSCSKAYRACTPVKTAIEKDEPDARYFSGR